MIDNCVLCGAEVTIACETEEFRAENPLADHYQLTCAEGCPNNGWAARNAEHMIEEWNETQRLLRVRMGERNDECA